MPSVKKININKLTIPFILLIIVWVSANMNWGDKRWEKIIKTDGTGYYAYLPAIFIYNDLNFGFFDKVKNDTNLSKNLDYNYKTTYNNKTINKYYAGTALAQLPFFIMGHFANYIFGFPLDGYSVYYLIFINIATIFYLFVACFFLAHLLRLYKIKEKNISITLIAIVFGTNVFHYTVSEPSMSHIYSFAFVTAFLYFSKIYFKIHQNRYIIYSSILLGIIILIRPVNGLIIFILPFLSGDIYNFKKGAYLFFRNFKILIISLFLIFGIISIQLIIYKIQCGNFFIYSYKGEGFNFFDPQIINILFSYKKGLFVYTPLLFVSLFGGYFLFKKSKFQFFNLFGFLFILTYVLSSWYMWYYGGSFSSRVYIEYYALFGILLATIFEKISKKPIRKLFITLIIFLVLVCQIQTYQYKYAYFHWSEMNKEKYWDQFLRIDKLINHEKE